MFPKVLLRSFTHVTRASVNRGYKVAVIGSSGGCGQPISLLLKLDPKVSELLLFDIRGKGVSADLGHICTPAKVTEHISSDVTDFSFLQGSDIIVIPAGCPRVANEDPLILSRDSLFDANAPMIHKLANGVAKHCPKAMVLIITNPVNSLTPLFAEVMKQKDVHDPKRLFGVCTLDIVRANTFVAENQKFNVHNVNVPVIGGHGGSTILPLLSQVKGAKFSSEDVEKLTDRVKHGGDEVVRAKAGDGSATLSLAYAVSRFASRLMSAMNGDKDVVECAYVENDLTASSYVSTPVLLGPNGVEKVLHWGKLSDFEQAKLDVEVPILVEQVKRGVDFVKAKAVV